MAVNVGVYAAGLVSGLIDGSDAQQDYFLALAKTDAGVEAGEYYRQAPQQVMAIHSVLQRVQPGSLWVMQTLLLLEIRALAKCTVAPFCRSEFAG